MSNEDVRGEILGLTTRIVSAQVSNNKVAITELPELINSVHQALTDTGKGLLSPLKPAVPIKKSVTPDYLICLDDGKKLKMLKRHLRTAYDMSPEEYRAKWGLPLNYPMVAQNYAQLRSKLAKAIGLGTKGRDKTKSRRKARTASS
jgi:predicted transcriptional regulator